MAQPTQRLQIAFSIFTAEPDWLDVITGPGLAADETVTAFNAAATMAISNAHANWKRRIGVIGISPPFLH